MKQPASWRYEVGRTSAMPERVVTVHGRLWRAYNPIQRELVTNEGFEETAVPLAACR
jgi:hypothetical protein